MYAIIVTGGKQYKVEEGKSIFVEKLDAKQGDKVLLLKVLLKSKARKRRLLPSSTSQRSTPTLSKVTVNHTLRLRSTRLMLNAEVRQ